MSPELKKKVFILLAALVLAVILIRLGVSTTPEMSTQTVSGTYTGVNAAGDPITLTLEQDNQAFKGQGTIAGKPVVISGVLAWEAVGSLAYSDASSSSVRLGLSSDGETLAIKTLGQPDIALNRGGTPVVQPPGPFSGKFRSAGPAASLANVTILQSGSLITGFAQIFDQTAAVTGKVTDINKAAGRITFLDESQSSFHAELSTDKNTITIFGMGNPIVFERF